MKGGSNIISSIHHLKQAVEHWESFQREHPGSKGDKLFEVYKKRVQWIYTDVITHPFLPHNVTDGIKKEWASDVFTPQAIEEKIRLLNPDQREAVDVLLDSILNGEQITVNLK